MTLLLISIAFIGSFPFQPRQTSLLTLLTVGVPALALAYWAHPGRVASERLLPALARFLLPVAVTICLVAIGVYLAVLIPASLRLPVPDNPYREGALPLAQTALTIFLVLCGLILLLFLEPPTRARPGKQGRYSNWRPSLLVLGLFICLLIILAVPSLRALFNLQALNAMAYVIIMGAALLWAVLLWLILHFHLFERVFQGSGTPDS